MTKIQESLKYLFCVCISEHSQNINCWTSCPYWWQMFFWDAASYLPLNIIIDSHCLLQGRWIGWLSGMITSKKFTTYAFCTSLQGLKTSCHQYSSIFMENHHEGILFTSTIHTVSLINNICISSLHKKKANFYVELTNAELNKQYCE